MLQVLGPEAQTFISTGDPVSDQASRARFVQAYDEAHTLVQMGATQVILQMGKDAWPFPIPLVKECSQAKRREHPLEYRLCSFLVSPCRINVEPSMPVSVVG